MKNFKNIKDTTIQDLGKPGFNSPLLKTNMKFLTDEDKISIFNNVKQIQECIKECNEVLSFEKAGAREKIFFDPKKTVVGVVTCGGLCPGLNDVIRAVCITASDIYKVKKVIGFKYGFQGITKNPHHAPIELTESVVKDIDELPGTILGTSRGPQDPDEMIDVLLSYNVNILIVIGGDGSLKGAMNLANRIKERGEKISVVGVPKTIDNDICWISRSFGFLTAVALAKTAVNSAHTEARAVYNGVGVVKLMGRESGYIASRVTLSSSNVNFCLIPEVDFNIEGEDGLLEKLKRRLVEKHHALIVVAEGAGQKYFDKEKLGKDVSGNQKLGDIGLLLKDKIHEYLKKEKIEHAVKYIDPSYIIRSQVADAADSEFCLILGQNAVHAAMAGKTNMSVGIYNEHYVHIPIEMMVGCKKKVSTESKLWETVQTVTCNNKNKEVKK